MSNAEANITSEESADAKIARLNTGHDHTHDATGHFLNLAQTQDAASDHCPDCGRSVYSDPGSGQTQPFHHAATCAAYRPHPHSIAAQERAAQGLADKASK